MGGLPWYGRSYDGCNIETYPKWADNGHNAPVGDCTGPTMCGGIQCFIVPLLIIFPLNKLVIVFGFTRWRTPEEAEPGFSWGKEANRKTQEKLGEIPPDALSF